MSYKFNLLDEIRLCLAEFRLHAASSKDPVLIDLAENIVPSVQDELNQRDEISRDWILSKGLLMSQCIKCRMDALKRDMKRDSTYGTPNESQDVIQFRQERIYLSKIINMIESGFSNTQTKYHPPELQDPLHS